MCYCFWSWQCWATFSTLLYIEWFRTSSAPLLPAPSLSSGLVKTRASQCKSRQCCPLGLPKLASRDKMWQAWFHLQLSKPTVAGGVVWQILEVCRELGKWANHAEKSSSLRPALSHASLNASTTELSAALSTAKWPFATCGKWKGNCSAPCSFTAHIVNMLHHWRQNRSDFLPLSNQRECVCVRMCVCVCLAQVDLCAKSFQILRMHRVKYLPVVAMLWEERL